MKLLIVLLVLFLQACAPYSTDNHGFGWTYDYITPLGIEVRVDKGDPILSSEIIDAQYVLMSECLGYNTEPANLMIILSDQTGVNTLSIHDNAYGVFISHPNLAVIRNRDSVFAYMVIRTLRHEMIHYIYLRELGNPDSHHAYLNDVNYETCTEI